MNILDPRFFGGYQNRFYTWYGDNEDPQPTMAEKGTLAIMRGTPKEGNPLHNAPLNSLVYSDGKHFINFIPHNNQRFIDDSENTGTIDGSSVEIHIDDGNVYLDYFLPHRIPPMDMLLKSYGDTKPTKNTDTEVWAVGERFLSTKDLKVYTVTALSTGSTATITWDAGTAVSSFTGSSDYLFIAVSRACSFYAYVNRDGKESLTDIRYDNGDTFYCKETGKYYCVVDHVFVKVGGGSELKYETHTLTAEEVTAKSFTLSSPAVSTSAICFVEGLAQAVNVAFAISGDTFSWDGKTLDGHLQMGDVIIVQYYA